MAGGGGGGSVAVSGCISVTGGEGHGELQQYYQILHRPNESKEKVTLCFLCK